MVREKESNDWQIDLILHRIFSYLPKADLLSCSLVNLSWNFNARAALRKKDCMAIINGKCPCQDIRNLCSTLQTSSNIPFNGLSVSSKYSLCLGSPHVHCTSEEINAFKNIRLQHVKLHYGNESVCSSLTFIDIIIRHNNNNLITLEIKDSGCRHRPSFIKIPDPVRFPNLRIVTIPCGINEEFLTDLLSASPNLEEIHGGVYSSEVKVLVEIEKIHLVKEFQFKYMDVLGRVLDHNACRKFALAEPKLRKLSAHAYDFHRNKKHEYYWCILEPILGSGRSSLEFLEIDFQTLLLLSANKQIICLDRLRVLELEVPNSNFIVGCLEFDWKNIFPNLTTFVLILVSDKPSISSTREGSKSCTNNESSPCHSVIDVTVYNASYEPVPNNLCQFLSVVFPTVTHFKTQCANLNFKNARKYNRCNI